MRLFCLLILALLPLRAEPLALIRAGESFRYRLNWGVLIGVGEIRIDAAQPGASTDGTRKVSIDIASNGLARVLYPYTNHAEVRLDQSTGRILDIIESGRGFCHTDSTTRFDYEQKRAIHTDRADARESRELTLTDDAPMDLISALVSTRHWQAKPGDTRTALAIFDGKLYPVTLTAVRLETIRTRSGQQSALLIVPSMAPGEERGIFKRGGEIKVWISQDNDPQPVKMQITLSFGTGTLHLVEHSAPATTTLAQTSP